MLDFITGFDETQPLHCLGSSVHSFKFLLYYMRRNGNDRASQAHLHTQTHQTRCTGLVSVCELCAAFANA